MSVEFKIFLQFILLFVSYNVLCQKITKRLYYMPGTEKYISADCNDSCVITYKNYTIVTSNHINTNGENIILINNNEKSRTVIDVGASYNAQFYGGLYGDKLIIDAGTGTIRINYIYSIPENKIIDSLYMIINNRLINGKMYFDTAMDQEKIDRLKLPVCDYPVENSGYWEEKYYDFRTRKIALTGKYKCIGKLPDR